MNNMNLATSEFYIVVGNNIYVSSPSNVNVENGVSFKNISTGKYLRHYGGRIIESNFSDTDIFKYDSTFVLCNIGKYVTLSCSNGELVDMYVCFDTKKICLQYLCRQIILFYLNLKNILILIV